MRSSSSALKAVALFLASTLAAELAAPAALAAAAQEAPEPCLILRFAAPEVSDNAARAWTEDLPAELEKILRVRWVSHPEFSRAGAPPAIPPDPAPAPGELARIARLHDEAKALLERLETAEAARLLDVAAGEAARFLDTDAAASLLAAILLSKAVLFAGEGDGKGAEEALVKARSLRPGFVPDPAIYSPRFLDAWNAASLRDAAPASVLVRSVPDGAQILVDGDRRGTTPGSVPVRHDRAVRVRVERPGFAPAERAGTVRLLGRVAWEGDRAGSKEAAIGAGTMLIAAGWPPSPKIAREKRSPWYYKWWFWGLVGVAAAGVATAVAGGGGSGGGSGSSGSTGSVDVTF